MESEDQSTLQPENQSTSESEAQAAPEVQVQSAPQSQPQQYLDALNIESPYMRRVMKESAYQLAEKLQAFIKKSELTYNAYTHDQFTHPRSLRPIEDSVRTGFNSLYSQWFVTLVVYFSRVSGNRHTDILQYGSFDVEPWTMPHEKAVEIVKFRIGWLLIVADEFQVDIPQG